jgi:hypothetical protein
MRPTNVPVDEVADDLYPLLQNRNAILSRLTLSQLQRYDTLQRVLQTTDVSTDRKYQRMFNGFYRMQRRPESWYRFFFCLLESEKGNASLSFEGVLEKIQAHNGRVEPSFCSKLVATIRPEMPVYDKHVRKNLKLRLPKTNASAATRLRTFVVLYEELTSRMNRLTADPGFGVLRAAFDQEFPAYAHFTDLKKLDLLLWQQR